MKNITQLKRIKFSQTASSVPGLDKLIIKLRSTAKMLAFALTLMLSGVNMVGFAQSFTATLMSTQTYTRAYPCSYVCGGTYGTFTCVNPGSSTFSYATQAFTVSTAGNVTINVTGGTVSDPMIFVYTGSFNPGSPTANFKVGDDDSGPGLYSSISACANYFNAGTYVIVATSYGSGAQNGTINFTLGGGSGPVYVLPTVSTSTASGIGSNSVTLGGNVTSDGGATVTAKGVAWGTSSNPTTGTAMGSGTGSYSATVSSLSSGTLYYYRAYATNSVGTAYGTQSSYTTLSFVAPTVTTSGITSITYNSASSGGNVTSDGGSGILERGICWNTSTNPTTSNYKTSVSGTTGSFTAGMSSLSASTRYYVRAYARNSVGTSYGANQSFVTNHIVTYNSGGNGSISGTTTQYIADLGSGTQVTAVPSANYSFLNWSDGSSVNPRTETNVTSSKTITANFTINRLSFNPQPSSAVAGQNIPFTMRIVDAYGNTMTNSDGNTITIAIANNAGGGTIAGTLTLHPSGGVVSSVNIWINKTGNGYTLSASASPLTGATSGSFNITPAAIDHFTVVGITDPVVAGTTTTPVVTAYDQYNNIKTNYTGTIVFSSDETPLVTENFPANYTFLTSNNGIKTFTNGVILKTTGERTVRVNDEEKTGVQSAITVTPAIINHFTLVANGPITAGTEFTVTATVYDEYNNVKTNYDGPNSVLWTTTALSSANGTSRIMPENGVQNFTEGVATIGGFTFFNSDQDPSPTITITDGPTSSPGTTDPITIFNAPLDNFKVVTGTSQTAGVPFDVTVTARDVYWNICIDYSGSIRFKSSDDNLVVFPPGLQSFAGYNGVRTFTNGVRIDVNGAYWLRAADAAFAYKSGDQQNIVVSPGAFSELTSNSILTISDPTTPATFVDPIYRVAGEYVFVTATPRDAYDNLLYSCRDISILLNGSTSDYDGPIIVTNVGDGTYTAVLRVTLTGNNTISARFNENDPGIIFAQTRTAIVEAAPVDLAHSLITADPQTMTTDEHSNITVQLKDEFDNNRITSDGVVTLTTDHGVLTGGVTDNNNGTYSATLYGNYGAVGIAFITGKLNGDDISDSETVTITEGLPSLADIEITANPETITTNETSLISVQLKDQFANLITTDRGTVILSSTLGALTAVSYTSNGIYQATLSGWNPGFGPSTVTGTFDGGAIEDNAIVNFDEGLPDLTQITITASPITMTSDESSIITVQLKDAYGNNLTTDRGIVTLVSDKGALSEVVYSGNGSYTATLTGDNRGFGDATITGSIAGDINGDIADDAVVTITEGMPALAKIEISPSVSEMTTDETSLITVQLKDQFGNNLSTSRGIITLETDLGALTDVTDNSDGTYSATLSGNNSGTGLATITGALDDPDDVVNGIITDNAEVTITEGIPALAQIEISAFPEEITTDETSTISIQLKDQWGNNLTSQRGTIALSSTIGHIDASAAYQSNGIYTAILSGDDRGIGLATITGILTDVADAVTGAIS